LKWSLATTSFSSGDFFGTVGLFDLLRIEKPPFSNLYEKGGLSLQIYFQSGVKTLPILKENWMGIKRRELEMV